MTEPHEIEGLDQGVTWAKADPATWRDAPEPAAENDDDEDIPTPPEVYELTGIDPDEEGW